MNELDQLYQQVILGHSHECHGSGALDAPDATSHQVSPTCDDDVTLGVRVKDNKAEAVSWEGDGCSISQAFIPIMYDLVNDANLAAAARLEADFDTLIRSHDKGIDGAVLDDLEDGVAFGGVSKYPNRAKCALLGWVALKDALTKSGVALPTVEPNDPGQPDRPGTTVQPTRKEEKAMSDNPSGISVATDNPMAAQQPPAPIANAEGVGVAAIEEALCDVIDPELGINIVDLGLLYGVSIEPDGTVVLDMTLTTIAYPLTDVIEKQAQQALSLITDRVRIQWVWLPSWGPDKITPEGREQLRTLGFNV